MVYKKNIVVCLFVLFLLVIVLSVFVILFHPIHCIVRQPIFIFEMRAKVLTLTSGHIVHFMGPAKSTDSNLGRVIQQI
jgi:hypothetical protein